MRFSAFLLAVLAASGCRSEPAAAAKDAAPAPTSQRVMPIVRASLTAPVPAPGEALLRFVAIGDTGKGNETQFRVGATLATVCARLGGCAFAVMLGDNFYPSGVADTRDPLWQSAFEQPYAAASFPFWAVLGNHDYGGQGAGWEAWRALAQVDYAKTGGKWRMPARHYAFGEGPADFVALDTNAIVWGFGEDQAAATDTRLAQAKRGWTFVLGHHPYRSNGPHGNAGTYDDRCVGSTCTCATELGRVPCGREFKAFFDAHVCGHADVYLAGHDHSLQDLGPACGVQLFVSGAASSPTSVSGRNPSEFQRGVPGFFVFEATARELVARVFDADGVELHARRLTKQAVLAPPSAQ